jgi:hypothetical protein
VLNHEWTGVLLNMNHDNLPHVARWWLDVATLVLWSSSSELDYVRLRWLYPDAAIMMLSRYDGRPHPLPSAPLRLKAFVEQGCMSLCSGRRFGGIPPAVQFADGSSRVQPRDMESATRALMGAIKDRMEDALNIRLGVDPLKLGKQSMSSLVYATMLAQQVSHGAENRKPHLRGLWF